MARVENAEQGLLHRLGAMIVPVAGPLGLSVAGMGAGLLFMLLMARWYGPAVVGRYGLMQTAVQICLLFAMLGTNRSVIRYAAMAEQQGCKLALGSFWRLIVPVGLFLAVGLLAGSGLLARGLFSDPDLRRYYQVGCVTLLCAMAASLWATAHHGRHAVMLSVTLRELVPLATAAVMMVLLAQRIDTPAEPAWFYAAGWLVAACFGGGLWWRYRQRPDRTRSLCLPVREVLRGSLPMLLASASFLVLGWTDTLMLGIYHDAETVGIYRVGLKVSLLITIGAQAVRKMAAPRMAAACAGRDTSSLQHWVQWTALANVMLVWPLGIVVWLVPFQLLSIFDSGFAAAAPIMLILCGGEMLRALLGMPVMVLEMSGHAGAYQKIMLSAAGLNVLLNVLLVPTMAGEGAAFATASSCVFAAALACRMARKRYGSSISFAGILLAWWKQRGGE